MQFSTTKALPSSINTDCVVVGVHENAQLTRAAAQLDKASSGLIRALIKSGDMDGKPRSTRLLFNPPGIAAKRVLLVGLGPQGSAMQVAHYRDSVAAALNSLQGTGASKAAFFLCEATVAGHDKRWQAAQIAQLACEAGYRFDATKSKKPAARNLRALNIASTLAADIAALRKGVQEGAAIGSGITLARELGNLPANVCTPTYLANEAKKLGRSVGLTVEVMDRKAMEKLGMRTLLSVAQGSHQPPRFIVMRYQGAAKQAAPVVLVGKGITFDTGGISLKPGGEMDEMKFDMCGAASVFGTMRAIAEMSLKINVIALVPATENMPGGGATKPGDVITSMSGQTVEILNTDAEGRLILCDALTYAERFKPAAVIDIATLTGACIIALGHVCSGLFSPSDRLAGELTAAADEAWDRVWRLPLWDDYQELLRSNFADFANIGGRAAGSVTAACFLARFAKKFEWAHLDIAGTAWKSGKDKGATGRPVALLTRFLMQRAGR